MADNMITDHGQLLTTGFLQPNWNFTFFSFFQSLVQSDLGWDQFQLAWVQSHGIFKESPKDI